ncbi:MAG: hypothetical protein V4773_01210 [Verrucomicrobiota bacterium]
MILFVGCAKKARTAQQIIEVPVSITLAEMKRSPQIDGFGSNLTTGSILKSLSRDPWWNRVAAPAVKARAKGDLRKSWKVDTLGHRDEGKVILVKFRVSVWGDPEDDIESALEAILQAFEAECRRIFSEEFAPYVRKA